MGRFSVSNVCPREGSERCKWNIVMLTLSVIATASVAQGIYRAAVTLRRSNRGLNGQLTRTVASWGLALLIADVLYHSFGLFMVMDGDAPPLYVGMQQPYITQAFQHTVVYNLVREAFGLVSLWCHVILARILCSWTVSKSVATPRTHLHSLIVVFSIVLTTFRYSLVRLHQTGTVLAEVVMYHAIIIPAVLACIVPCYIVAIRHAIAAYRKSTCHACEPQKHLPPFMRPRKHIQYAVVLCALFTVRLSCAVLETVMWVVWARGGHTAPVGVYWASLVATRVVGLVDAAIVGHVCASTLEEQRLPLVHTDTYSASYLSSYAGPEQDLGPATSPTLTFAHSQDTQQSLASS